MRKKGGTDLKWHLSKVRTTTADTYAGNASEVFCISKPGQTNIAHALTYTKCPHKALLLQHYSSLGQECQY